MSTETELLAASGAHDLVPGDPRRLNDVAGLLHSYAEDLASTATAFGALDSTSWTGQAAERFRATFDLAPAHWRTASDAFGQASRAMSVYATSLLLAQNTAQDALTRFRRGLAELGPTASYGGRGGMGVVGGDTDPGAHDRALAVIALDDARAHVRTAGTTAHNAVRAATTNAPESPAWWQTAATVLGALALDGAETGWNQVLVPLVNGIATTANAMTADPFGSISIVGGAALVLAGGAVDAGGVAVCATGVGCAATPAAEAAGTGMILSGVGLVGAGAVSIAGTAAANPITIVERTGSGRSSPPPSAPRHVSPSSPAASPVWKATSPYRGKYRWNGLTGKKAEYYRWDYTHNEIEVYNAKGWEIGSRDPVTNAWTKGPPAKPRQPEELR